MERLAVIWETIKGIDIIRGLIALLLVGTLVYLSVVGAEVSETLKSVTLLTIGFYFGQKINAT